MRTSIDNYDRSSNFVPLIYTAANKFVELNPVLTQTNFTLYMKHWKILIEKTTGRSYKQRTLEKYWPVKFRSVILYFRSLFGFRHQTATPRTSVYSWYPKESYNVWHDCNGKLGKENVWSFSHDILATILADQAVKYYSVLCVISQPLWLFKKALFPTFWLRQLLGFHL